MVVRAGHGWFPSDEEDGRVRNPQGGPANPWGSAVRPGQRAVWYRREVLRHMERSRVVRRILKREGE